MATTANGLPIVTDDDTFDPPAHFSNLSSTLDRKIVGGFASTVERDLAYPTPSDRQIVYTDDDDVLWLRRAGVWRKLFSDSGWLNLPLNSPWAAVTGTGSPGAKYRLKTDECHFAFRLTRGSGWTGPVQVGTFPEGARPPFAHDFRATKDATDGIGDMKLTVYQTGLVELNNNGQANNVVYVAGSFPID